MSAGFRYLPERKPFASPKNGITARDNSKVTVTDNTVTGQGHVSYIAQNGIQIGYGAKATATPAAATKAASAATAAAALMWSLWPWVRTRYLIWPGSRPSRARLRS